MYLNGERSLDMTKVLERTEVKEEVTVPLRIQTLQVKMKYSDSGDSDVDGLLLNDVVLWGLSREIAFTDPLNVVLKVERYGNFIPQFKCQLVFNSIVCNIEIDEPDFVLMLEDYFRNFLFKNKMYVKDYCLDYSNFTINFNNEVPVNLTRNRRV